MADGTTIEESTTYNETVFSTTDDQYTPAGTYNMYTGREPRFYATVMYNNRTWSNPGLSVSGQVNYQVDFTYNGADGRKVNHDCPPTGYLLNNNFPYRPGILYRLAEIYLNYIEALNESDPGNSDIIAYLNLIRVRGGLPELTNSYSQDQMRELIRRERQIELCFENAHRFFDIRRWKIAAEVYNQDIHGMNIQGTSPTIGDGQENFYRRILVYRVNYGKKTNLLPIPQYVIDRNIKLVQNPDW